MLLKLMRVTVVAAVVAAAWHLVPGGESQQALAAGRQRSAPNVFYNYYAAPGRCGYAGAQLYIAPRPTPPLVGHTYITYQPLMPHEFLYPHHRTYVQRHADCRVTKTHVWWH